MVRYFQLTIVAISFTLLFSTLGNSGAFHFFTGQNGYYLPYAATSPNAYFFADIVDTSTEVENYIAEEVEEKIAGKYYKVANCPTPFCLANPSFSELAHKATRSLFGFTEAFAKRKLFILYASLKVDCTSSFMA